MKIQAIFFTQIGKLILNSCGNAKHPHPTTKKTKQNKSNLKVQSWRTYTLQFQKLLQNQNNQGCGTGIKKNSESME